MRVGIDEAGGKRLSAGRDVPIGAGRTKVANGGDAVAGHADAGGEAWGTGAVEDGDIAEDRVVVQAHVPSLP